MHILWKIYFWLLAVIILCAYVIEVIHFSRYQGGFVLTVIDLLVSIPAYVIFWAYVFRKTLFTQPYLKIYVIAFLCWEVAVNLFLYPFIYKASLGMTLPDLIIYLPEYVALVLYAFKRR